jgi:hypothetical protein
MQLRALPLVLLVLLSSVAVEGLSLQASQRIPSHGLIVDSLLNELIKRGDEVIAAQNPDGGWTVHCPNATFYDGTGGADFMAISSATTGLLFLWIGTGLQRFLDAAKKAFKFIIDNQNPDGGWGMPWTQEHWNHTHPAGESYTVITVETVIALCRARDMLNTTDYDAALMRSLGYFNENFAFQTGDTWTFCPKSLYPPDFQDIDMEIYVNNVDAMVCGALSYPFLMYKAPYNKARVNAAVDHILSTQQTDSPFGFPYGRDDPNEDMGYSCFTLWGLLLYNRYIPDYRIAESARKLLSTWWCCAGVYEGNRTFLNGDSNMVASLPFDNWVTEVNTYNKKEEAARNALFRTTILPLKDEQGRITRAGLSNLLSMTGYLVIAYLAP